MPVQICQLYSDDKRNVDKLLKMLSLLSQMKNDYLNLTSGEVSCCFLGFSISCQVFHHKRICKVEVNRDLYEFLV